MVQPFKIAIEQHILDDLKSRLASTRWPDEIDNVEWQYGTNMSYLREICQYWEKDFDWRKQETYLNGFAHFTTTIDDETIHFIHQKGEGNHRIPLLLTHGYPDSFIRFLKIAPLLNKADKNGVSFDLIIPSIPGYGFSSIPATTGMDTRKIADLLVTLMTKELGYDKFAAHGGDWGSSITEQIALYHADHLLAIHLTDIPFQHVLTTPKDVSQVEQKFLATIPQWQLKEGAYTMIQSTKPQTLAYGLNDSPVGLAAWILEKFNTWSDNHGNIESCFSKDELLTNITIYWATQTIDSAIHLYREAMRSAMQAMYNPMVKLNPFDKTGDKIEIPTGFAIFPKDIAPPPKEFAQRFFNVQQWSKMEQGGHFAALEQPTLLAAEIRKFFSCKLINYNTASSQRFERRIIIQPGK